MNDDDILAVLREIRDDQRTLIALVADAYKRNEALMEESRATQKRSAAFIDATRATQATAMKISAAAAVLLALLLLAMVLR